MLGHAGQGPLGHADLVTLEHGLDGAERDVVAVDAGTDKRVHGCPPQTWEDGRERGPGRFLRVARWPGVRENLIMSNSDLVAIAQPEIAELLLESGHHHHQAYAESDGVDPEWALWYSGYLQSRLWDRAGSLPTRSLLVHLLLSAERDHAATTGEVPWSQFYAGVILAALTGS